MSSRGRRGRGRPPKTSLSGSRSHFLRKPKYTKSATQLHESDSGNSCGNSRSSTPVSTTSSTLTGRMSTRARGRDHIFKSRSYFQHLQEDSNDLSDDEELGGSVSDLDDELGLEDGNDSDFTLIEDGASVCSAESDSTFSSTPGKRKYMSRRPRTPEFIDEADIPPLVLPTSSTDLLLENEYILQAIGIYEVLRHFRTILRLSPYRFEDFCAALVSDEQNCLLAETHIALLRALQRNDESTSTTFGPSDLKDSINICFYFLDAMTWPEVIWAYLDSERSPEFRHALPSLEHAFYSQLNVKERLHTLQSLTDIFLSCTSTREEIMSEGNIKYDDHCRACHRLGDLLCCETCSAVYHLACVEPAMEEVPEDDWHCNVCTSHQVKGVTDCISDTEKHGLMCRQDPIGYDRHGRKYWFLARRLFIDGQNEVWYYSTPHQITEVLDVLDRERWERHLYNSLLDVKEDIIKHMNLTEALTTELKGNKKAAIELEIENLTKVQADRLERRKKEEEERRAREEEEMRRREEEERKRLAEEARWEEEEEKRRLTEAGWIDETRSVETSTTNTSSVMTHVSSDGDGVTTQVTENVATTVTTITSSTSTVTTATEKTTDENSAGDSEVKPEIVKQEGSLDPSSGDSITNALTPVSNTETKPAVSGLASSITTTAPKTTVLITKDGNKVMLAMVKPENQSSSQAEENGSSSTVISTTSATTTSTATQETRRILTRSRTGSLTPKVFTDSIVGNFKLSTKSSSDEVLIISKDGDISTIQKNKTVLSVFNQKYFKLGMETTYKQWVNLYSTNSLALNKHQHNEDRDRRRFLSHKFSLTPLSEFKWNGNVYGNSSSTVATLRASILQLENNIASAFLHTSWPAQRQNWIKAVNMCEKPQDFALALAILEACIKPLLFNPVWSDSLGHTRMQRITSNEKEEIKKREKEARKQLDTEEERERMTWIKYTLGLKHQVYKQKGEEYRVHGNGGWLWLSSIRNYKLVPQDTVGLRRIAKMLNHTRRKAKEQKESAKLQTNSSEAESEMETSPVDIKTEAVETNTENPEPMETGELKSSTEEPDIKPDLSSVKMETEAAPQTEAVPPNIEQVEPKKLPDKELVEPKKEPEVKNKSELKLSPAETTEMEAAAKMLDSVPPTEVINISDGLKNRTHYPKFKKPAAKLDGLLERRVKQYELEQKQKTAIESVISKYKQQEELKRKVLSSSQTRQEEPEVDVVNVKTEPNLTNGDIKTEEEDEKMDIKTETDPTNGQYVCYSAVCRVSKESKCYSVSCQNSSSGVKVEESFESNSIKSENGHEKMDTATSSENSSDPSSSNGSVSGKTSDSKSKKPGVGEGSSTPASKASKPTSQTSSSSSSTPAPASKSTTTVTTLSNTAVGQTIASLIQGGKIALTSANVADLEMKLAQVGKTNFSVSLARLQRGPKSKSKLALKKGSLPVCHKFLTKSKKRSLFILEKHELKSLSRRAGMKETKGFNYNCKMNNVNWVYPCPRPRFKTAWRYRTQNLKTVAAAAIQLRVMWASLRWDDMAVKPPAGGTNTVTTDTDITTKELLKRRDVGPYGLQSEFLVRKIVVPIGIPAQPREKYTPQRSGLRERKRPESPKIKEPSLTESWFPEEDLELWEIKVFGEKVEKQRAAIQEKIAQQHQVQKVATSATAIVSAKSGQTTEELRNQMEAQLKQQRLAMQQKRLAEQQGQQAGTPTTAARSIVLNSTLADSSKSTTVIQLSSLQQPAQKTMLIAPGNSKSLQPVRVLTSGGTLASAVPSSTIKVTPIKPAGQVGQTKQIQISPKTIFTGTGGRYGGQVQLPATTITVRPKATISSSMAGVAAVKSIAPSTVVSTGGQTVRLANNQVQVRPTSTVTTNPAPAPTTGQVQNLRIIQGPHGQIQVQGLLPGQQIIRLPDGRLQLLTLPTTQVQPQAQPQPQTAAQPPQLSAQVSAAPAPQKQIQLMQNQVAIRPQTAVVATQPTAPSIAIAAPTLSAASAAPTIIVSSAMAATPTIAAATVAAPTTQLRMPVTSLAGAPKLVQVPGVGGTTRLVLTSPQVAGAQPTIVRTQSGQQVLIRPQIQQVAHAAPTLSTAAPAPLLIPSTHAAANILANKTLMQATATARLATPVAVPVPAPAPAPVPAPVPAPAPAPIVAPAPVATESAPAAAAAAGAAAPVPTTPKPAIPKPPGTPGTPGTPAPVTAATSAAAAAAIAGGKYSLTTQVLQQVVRQAMLQNQDPDIQAKLVAMQKQMTAKKEADKVPVAAPPPAIASNLAEAAKPKSKPLTAEQREEQNRMSVCVQVMKGLLDKIEREEKLEQKRQKKAESAEEKQKRIMANKLQALLFKQKEALKKDMMKKRALMEKALSTEIQSEVSEVVKMQRKKAGKKRREDITSGSDSEFEPPKQKKKKRMVMPGKGHPREKLFCVCKKPYDDTKFYIGCDLCSNWFHGRCVGISEDKAQFIDSYICDMCKKQQETASEELYCICRTSYDETQFYIGCDQCQDWFHGRCVGVTKAEADHMDSYICPNCQNTNNQTATAQILVSDTNFDELRRILNGLMSHKMAWPFLQPVKQEDVPDYYRVIKEPMDMSRVEQKLLNREYAKVGDYIKDVTKIFDNCRYYNPTDSPFYRCAEVLETLFVQKLKALKDKL